MNEKTLLERIDELEKENARLKESLLRLTIIYTEEVANNCEYNGDCPCFEDSCDCDCGCCYCPDEEDDTDESAERAFDYELFKAQVKDAASDAYTKGKEVTKKAVNKASAAAKRIKDSDAFKSLLNKGEELVIKISKNCKPNDKTKDNKNDETK